MEERGLFLN